MNKKQLDNVNNALDYIRHFCQKQHSCDDCQIYTGDKYHTCLFRDGIAPAHWGNVEIINRKEEISEGAEMNDISKQILETGKVCYNTNNYTKCIVIDGNQGDENDRCSRVLEMAADGTLFIHTPPNRALVPTGEFFDVSLIKNVLDMSEGQQNWVRHHINNVCSQHSTEDCEQNCIDGGDCSSLMSDEEKITT